MRATAAITAELVGGRTRLTRLRSEAPLLLRPTRDALYLVGGAAGPLGGDRCTMGLSVDEGACLTVRSAGATMVLGGAPASTFLINARVEANASLDWAPEPTISTSQSNHSQAAHVSMTAHAQLRWRELIVLGRSGEPPGKLCTSLRITRDDKPVVHNGLRLDASIVEAGLGGARVVLTEVLIGRPSIKPFVAHQGQARASVVVLEPDVVLIQAVGDSPDQVEALARRSAKL